MKKLRKEKNKGKKNESSIILSQPFKLPPIFGQSNQLLMAAQSMMNLDDIKFCNTDLDDAGFNKNLKIMDLAQELN